MRTIKFRAWTGAKMEYNVLAGSLGAFYVQGLDPRDLACISPMNTIYPKETPIMQFTGLHDKNGKEIYEGDVLKTGEPMDLTTEIKKTKPLMGFKYVVLYNEGAFQVRISKRKKKHRLTSILIRASGLEIIGNIYESPELLNQSK